MPPRPPGHPLVERVVTLLRACPQGASRRDILAAMPMTAASWRTLRDALHAHPAVRAVGRGAGQRLVHVVHAPDAPNRAEPRHGEGGRVLRGVPREVPVG